MGGEKLADLQRSIKLIKWFRSLMIFMITKSSLDSIYLIKRIYRLDQKKIYQWIWVVEPRNLNDSYDWHPMIFSNQKMIHWLAMQLEYYFIGSIWHQKKTIQLEYYMVSNDWYCIHQIQPSSTGWFIMQFWELLRDASQLWLITLITHL